MVYVGEMECYKCDNHVQGFYDAVYDWTIYECDECNELVKFTGLIGMSNPPKYKHTCKCGVVYCLDIQYPTFIYK